MSIMFSVGSPSSPSMAWINIEAFIAGRLFSQKLRADSRTAILGNPGGISSLNLDASIRRCSSDRGVVGLTSVYHMVHARLASGQLEGLRFLLTLAAQVTFVVARG